LEKTCKNEFSIQRILHLELSETAPCLSICMQQDEQSSGLHKGLHPQTGQVSSAMAEMSPPWGTGRVALCRGRPGRSGEWPGEICGWCTKAALVVLETVFSHLFLRRWSTCKTQKAERSSQSSVKQECQVTLGVQCPSWCFTAAAAVSR